MASATAQLTPSEAAAAVMGDHHQPTRVDVNRHTKYFLRCLKTYLPTAYQSNDSNRMSLAFFIIAGLDLLGTLTTKTSPEERQEYTDWIYTNQLPTGGFRAFPGTNFGPLASPENARWDPANLPATYFALSTLLILGDDLSRVKRKETLTWLTKLQRGYGSFGETLVDGVINGGEDSRFGYCAMGIRYILRGTQEGQVDGVDDIDLGRFVECIRSAETYDGGISDAPYHEAHAGFTYCALAALSFTKRLNATNTSSTPHAPSSAKVSTVPTNPPHLLHWLCSRQTTTISPEDEADTYGDETDTPETCHDAHTFIHPQSHPSKQGKISYETRPDQSTDLAWTGYNGRCNKIADTCYAFWVGASLNLLNHQDLPAVPSLRRWLLEKTAHLALGGFGKLAGDLPDIYHSCLGLAALSLMGDEDLKPLDAAMCISKEAKGRLNGIWKRWGVDEVVEHA